MNLLGRDAWKVSNKIIIFATAVDSTAVAKIIILVQMKFYNREKEIEELNTNCEMIPTRTIHKNP